METSTNIDLVVQAVCLVRKLSVQQCFFYEISCIIIKYNFMYNFEVEISNNTATLLILCVSIYIDDLNVL